MRIEKKKYFSISACIFIIAGALHLWRIVEGWDLMLGPHLIPVWISWVVVVIAGIMAYNGVEYKN